VGGARARNRFVTADPASRAGDEVATASVMDREAIAAQAAVSISGTSVRRSAPTSSSASITVGTAADLSAFSASPRPRSIPMRTLVIALQPPAA